MVNWNLAHQLLRGHWLLFGLQATGKVLDTRTSACRMVNYSVQRGRSERKAEAYEAGTVRP